MKGSIHPFQLPHMYCMKNELEVHDKVFLHIVV